MSNFWKSKKVLVIGGTGFIGSHTVDELIRQGAKVAIVGRSGGGRFLNSKARFYRTNAASSIDMAKIFKKERPHFVMNFAATTDIPFAMREPLVDAESIFVLINILNNSVKFGVKKVLHASSGFIYGNTKHFPTPETEPLRPTNPYVISKIACENYLKFFKEQHGLPFVALRYANVYGPRRTTGAIAYFIRQVASGKSVEIYGEKTRDCIFVSDVARANLLAFEKNIKSVEPIFNIGSGVETDFIELHSIVRKILGKPDAKPQLRPSRPGEVDRMCLDIRKARRGLGFEPTVSLQEGLRLAIEWCRARGSKREYKKRPKSFGR